jgi:hypothetical protein
MIPMILWFDSAIGMLQKSIVVPVGLSERYAIVIGDDHRCNCFFIKEAEWHVNKNCLFATVEIDEDSVEPDSKEMAELLLQQGWKKVISS